MTPGWVARSSPWTRGELSHGALCSLCRSHKPCRLWDSQRPPSVCVGDSVSISFEFVGHRECPTSVYQSVLATSQQFCLHFRAGPVPKRWFLMHVVRASSCFSSRVVQAGGKLPRTHSGAGLRCPWLSRGVSQHEAKRREFPFCVESGLLANADFPLASSPHPRVPQPGGSDHWAGAPCGGVGAGALVLQVMKGRAPCSSTLPFPFGLSSIALLFVSFFCLINYTRKKRKCVALSQWVFF